MTIIPFRTPEPESSGTPPAEEPEVREQEFDEIEVMRRLASGDTAALQQIMEIFWKPLSAYASRLMDDMDAANDVTQSAFIRLWDRRAEWRPGSLRSYLFRLTRNLALDAIREQTARNRRERSNSRETRPKPRTPAELFERDEVGAQVDRAIQSLPRRRREVFTLAYLHGLSYRQIGEIMGISTKTVGNQMTAALSELRAALASLVDSQAEPEPGLDDPPRGHGDE